MELPVKQMIESSPALLAATRVYTDRFDLTINGVLNIYYDLTAADCDLIIEQNILRLIQFARGRLNEGTLQLINEKLLPSKSGIYLRETFNGYGAFNTLDFLAHLPNLKCLNVALDDLKEIEKINRYLILDELGIGTNKTSLKGIEQQTSLQKLFIFDRPKDIAIASQMHWLESLAFAQQSFRDLDFIKPIANLKELHFLSGSIKSLEALNELETIEKLSFTRVRLPMNDLHFINGMNHLKELSFIEQSQLTNLDWLQNKSIKLNITGCKNLKRQ